MLRLWVVPLVVLLGAGCVTQPATLAGSGGSAATGVGAAGGGGGAGGIGVGGAGAGGSGGSDWTCGGRDYVLERLPPEILILLDASGSMNEDASGAVCVDGCGATSKWAETVAAINATVARTEAAVNWGLKLFPDSAGKCSVGNAAAIPVGTNKAAAIAAALASRTSVNGGLANGGNTPTRTAENAAVTYLQMLTSPNPKFILMATDGLPNCVPGQTDTAADDVSGTILAVEAARAAGYPTFVIGVGIGNALADATLDEMAAAGGYPRAGAPAYYPVAGTAELESTLTTLVSVASSCTFALPRAPTIDGTTSRGLISVHVDGAATPQDASHTNGWDYTDALMDAIQIYGPVCDAVTAGQAHTVSISFICLAV